MISIKEMQNCNRILFQLKKMNTTASCLLLCLRAIYGCSREDHPDPFFTKISSRQTGITFENRITETDSLPFSAFSFIFNDRGVVIGDINKNGLVKKRGYLDIVINTGGPSQLFRVTGK